MNRWMSLNKLWENLMDDPFYGEMPYLRKSEALIIELKKEKLWIKDISAIKINSDEILIIDNLKCPACNNPSAWVFLEEPQNISCLQCRKDTPFAFEFEESFVWRILEENDFDLPITEKEVPQLALVHIWCGLKNLPFYKYDNNTSSYQHIKLTPEHYLILLNSEEYSMDKYVVNLADLNAVIKKMNLPLPRPSKTDKMP